MYEIEIYNPNGEVIVTFRTNYMPRVFEDIRFMRKDTKTTIRQLE